uniref:Uncharacterized protein orf205 n=1 Tax=Pedinomonas minor TaxID=3159 RepID=C7BEQ5_PEDMN|nr:hypothetical protein PrmiC_p055 [Pedinomonas minor]ACQ90896.1 unknown [Pedinomonas minor]
MMILKSLQWKNSTFFYFENETEKWWAFFSFLTLLKMKTSPKRIFEKYSFSHWSTKTFEDFSSSTKVLPKQTVFIATPHLQEFLITVQNKKALFNSNEFSELLTLIHQPTGEIVRKPARKKPTREKIESRTPELSDQEKILLDFIQQSVELANFAQQFIQSEKAMSSFDWKQLVTGVGLLNQTLKELKVTENEETELTVIDVDFMV